MSNTNDDTNMTGNADNCDPLRTKSGQGVSGTVHASIAFPSRDEAITALCQNVFGASPVFPDPVPEPTIPANCRNALRDAGKPAQPLSELAKLINSWDEYLITVEREIAERPTPDVAASIARAAADHIADQTDREMTERPTPITDAEWQTECCSGASWYRIAERMKNRAADLERQIAEVTKQRNEAVAGMHRHHGVVAMTEAVFEKTKELIDTLTCERDDWKAKAIADEVSKEIMQRIGSDYADLKAQLAEVTKQRNQLADLLEKAKIYVHTCPLQAQIIAALAAVKGGDA